MKNKKQLKKIVQKMIDASIKDGILKEKVALGFIKEIKKQPLSTAIFLLTEFKKGLKLKLSKHTLLIESAVSLSPLQVNKIKNELKMFEKIVKTEIKINPNLVAGLKIKLGDMVIDDTLKARATQLKGAMVG